MERDKLFDQILGASDIFFVDRDGNPLEPKFNWNGRQLNIQLIPLNTFKDKIFQKEVDKHDKILDLANQLEVNYLIVFALSGKGKCGTDVFYNLPFGPAQAVGLCEIAKNRLLQNELKPDEN